MTVEELSSYTPQDLADLDALMHELSATSFCNEELLNNTLNDANVHVYVIRDEGHIVAIKHTLECKRPNLGPGLIWLR